VLPSTSHCQCRLTRLLEPNQLGHVFDLDLRERPRSRVSAVDTAQSSSNSGISAANVDTRTFALL
jgi:hypothetical protein